MRPAVRMALAVTTTLTLSSVGLHAATAAPDPSGPTHPGPSQKKLDRAKRDVASKRLSVEQIEGRLAGAQAQLEAAAQAAELAFEKYNGARWALHRAKVETKRANAASVRAAGAVDAQRVGIIALVTESYQNGTALTTATALMSDEGPAGLMNRYGVVQSAGDSMAAAYERFEVASAEAEKYAGKASRAEQKQKSLAADAKQLAVAAGAAAAQAGEVTNQIASEKQQLVQALAEAENISIDLAKQRTDALEQVAAQKEAQAQQAQEAAQQAELQKQADQAAAQAKKSKKNQPKPTTGGAGGDVEVIAPVTGTPAPVLDAPPNQTVAVQRTIAYAKAQLGKPYQWAAAGPSTFDCSGLTMQAWARGGKRLPHYSVAQFDQSTPVRMIDARPGDLLFWSSNGSPGGIHHVALYVGGGQFIEAPRTGLDVRYNSIYTAYPDFVARP